jgi:hypothetical protein
MRFIKKQTWFGMAAVALSLMYTPASKAQLNSGASTVALTATLAESLTVTVPTAAVTFPLAPTGTTNGSTPVSITTTWALAGTRTSLSLYAWFASTTALKDAGTDIIPTSKFNGSINAGAYSAFTGGTAPAAFGGANSKTIFTTSPLTGAFGGTRTDSLGLQIDTTGLALPATTYTGTLNIQAQAI